MASACSFKAPNGEPSDLGIALEQQYGPAEAAKIMDVIHSEKALKVFNWVENEQYNTAKKELTPPVAKALYDAVENGTKFDPEANLQTEPERTVPENVDMELLAYENAGAYIKGDKRIMLRLKAEPGLEPGDSTTTYIGGVPMTMVYQGERASDGAVEDLVNLNAVTADDLTEDPEKKWTSGAAYHVYELTPMYTLADLLPKEAVGIKNTRIDQEALYRTLKLMVPEILNDKKEPTGKLYSFEDYKEINDVILRSLLTYLLPKISGANGKVDIVNEIIAGLNYAYRTEIRIPGAMFQALADAKMDSLPAESQFHNFTKGMSLAEKHDIAQKYKQALNSWSTLAKFATASLKEYGVVVKPAVLNRIEQLLKYNDKTVVPEGTVDVYEVPAEMEDYNVTVDEGRAVKDYSEKAINISLHSTASKNVKLYLAKLHAMEFSKEATRITADDLGTNRKTTDREMDRDARVSAGVAAEYNNFRLRAKINSLGQPSLVNHKELFIKLLKASQGIPAYEKAEVVKLLKQSKDPDLVNLGIQLETAPEQITNELFKVINNQYAEHTRLIVHNKNTSGKKEKSARNSLANKDSETASIIHEWKENQKGSKSVKIVNGRMIVNKSGATRAYNEIVKYGTELSNLKEQLRLTAIAGKEKRDLYKGRELTQAQNDSIAAPYIAAKKAYEEKATASMEYISKFMSYLGITGITSEMLRDLGKGGTWESTMRISEEGNAIGMFAVLAQSLKDASSKDDNESADLLKNANPLYRETTMINRLAKLSAKFSSKVNYATNHKSINGETIQNFSLPSFASDTYKALSNPEHPLHAQMLKNGFTQKADWLLKQIRAENGAKLTYLEGLVSAEKPNEGVERTAMSVREQFLVPLLMFHQSSSKADLVDMTKSDKTLTPVISNVTKFKVQLEGYGAEVMEQFVNIYKAEQERIVMVQTTEVPDPNLAKGGDLFFFMPAFNRVNMAKDLAAKRITQEQYDSVWNSDDKIQQVYNKDVVEPLIVKYMDEAITAEGRLWIKNLNSFDGFRQLPEKQVNFLLSHWYRLIPITKTVDGKKVSVYRRAEPDGSVTEIPREAGFKMAAALMIKQYVTQAFIVNTFSAMIVSGDPAVAFKKSKLKTATVNHHIKETLKDYQKRQAKDIAPGAIPAFRPSDTFVSLVINDEKMHSDMAALNSAYKDKDTIADAQEVTTVREQLTVMFHEGKIADSVYKEMLAVIDAGMQSPNKYYEFTAPAHTQIILQAQKPVYVSRRFTDGSYTIDYIKSSAFALLPSMTVGSELDKLRQKMEGELDKKGVLKNHVNRAVFGSGKKLGKPLNMVSLYDKYGKIKDGVLESKEFLNAQQTLSREGFKIQQEVPYKGDKEHISLVSQADRFITAGISDLQGFEIPGREPMSGKELKQLRLSTIKTMSNIALEKFTAEVGGIDKIYDADNAWVSSKLRDPNKFFDKLLAEAITKGYSENEIELLQTRRNNGRLEIPLWFSGSASKLESMVMSLIGEITIPKMPGKSFIRASSIGIKRYTTEIPPNAGIKYIKSFDPTKGLGFMTKNEGAPSGAAQVLVPFSFFDQAGKNLKIEDFMTDGVIDPAKLPDDLLRMVGMRIPNQGMNSMLPIQIVGFLPETMGDLIIVPAEITIQMGSDFDVDKLYTYRRNYNQAPGVLSTYQGEDKGKELQNTYFDIYWAALTHPDLFDAVTSPLDQPDMIVEKELAEGASQDTLSNFFMPSAQIESFDAQKDAKTMVAHTALSATFRADVEDMDIRLEDSEGKAVSILFFTDDNQRLELTKFSGVGRSVYVDEAGETHYRSKHDVNAALQNEVLDYAKNRTIDPLNINLKTYPVVDMLINLETERGTSIGWSHIARFTQQPIIKEYASRMSVNNDTFTESYSSDPHRKTINELYQKYAAIAEADPRGMPKQKAFSPAQLLEMARVTKQTKETAEDQLAILAIFDMLHAAGTVKMRAQNVYNRGPKGPGANFIQASEVMDKAKALNNNDSILVGLNELASEASQRGDEFNKTVGTAMALGNDVMPYKNIKPLITQLAQLKNRETMSYDDSIKVNNAMKAYTMSSPQMALSNDVNGRLAELLYGVGENESLATRVVQAKNTDWGKRNYFISHLRTRISTTVSIPSTVSYLPSKTTVFEDQENTKAIIELLTGNEEQRALMQDLIDYNYLTGAGGQTSYNQYIPISYMIGQGMHDRMHKIMGFDGWNGFGRNFVQQFLQHNPDFAPRLSSNLRGTMNQMIDPEARNRINETIVLVSSAEENAPFAGNYPEYFSITQDEGYLLYKFSGLTTEGKSSYIRIDTLGLGAMNEYNAADSYKRSLILKNRATIQNVALMDDGFKKADMGDFKRMPKTGTEKDAFYDGFVEVGETSTTVFDIIDKLEPNESPLLKVLKAATMQNVTVDSDMKGTERTAQYRPKFNRIQLDMEKIGSRALMLEMVEHEYVHGVTARTLMDISKLSDKQAREKYGPAVMDAYYSLQILREQLAEQFEGNEMMEYATSSVDELIAHAFSHRGFQKIANETMMGSQTMIDKFRNLINSLIKALAETMGFPINEGSALEQIIMDATAIIGSNGTGQDYKVQLDTYLGATVYMEDSLGTLMVPAEILTAVKDIEAHKKKLESMQFTQSSHDTATRGEFILRNQEIDALQADIDMLKTMGNFSLLATLGTRQVKWAKEILEQESKSFEDLSAAYHTAKTWSNLIKNIYDGVAPEFLSEEINTLSGDAQAIETRVLALFKQQSGVGYTEFDPENLSVNAAEANFRDLGQVKSKVGQMLYEKISEQKKYRVEELRKFNNKATKMVDKVQALAKKTGISYGDLMGKIMHQGSDWGLINQYSPALDKYQNQIQNKLQQALKMAYSAPNLNHEQRSKLIKTAKEAYKIALESKMSYINVNVLLDHETGELKTGARVDEEMEKLRAEIGEDTMNRMIDQAQKNYKLYLQDKESYENVVNASHEITIMQLPTTHAETIKKMSAGDKAVFLTEKATEAQALRDDKLRTWEGQNSPIVFYQMLSGYYQKGLAGQFRAYNRLVTAPKLSSTEFFDPTYRELMDDPKLAELKEVYEFIKDNLKTYVEMLPVSVQNKLGDSFLPIMEAADDTLSASTVWENTKDYMTNALLTKVDLMEKLNSERRQVPLKYINGKQLDVEDRERDPMVLLSKFADMALHFNGMTMVQSYAELAQQASIQATGKTKEGEFASVHAGAMNMTNMIQHYMDVEMYQKPRKPEGEIKTDQYSINPFKNAQIKKEIKDLTAERIQLYKDYNAGTILVSEFTTEQARIDARIAEINENKSYYSADKMADVAIKMTQLKALAWNPMSAIANVTFGIVSLTVHANARTDFDRKTMLAAMQTMSHATRKSLGNDNPMARKILALMERTNLMGDLLDADSPGESRLVARGKETWRKVISPYQMLRQSDYFMKGSIAVSMAKFKMIEVERNGKIETMSLWDAMDEEGRIEGNTEWYNEDDSRLETQFQAFRNQAVGVGKVIMGNQDSNSPLMAKRKALGRLASQFRVSWLAEGFAQRFEGEYFNKQLGRDAKGRYRTLGEFGLIDSLKMLASQALYMKTAFERDGKEISEVDKENMRKNLSEITWYLGMFAVVSILKFLGDDDDKQSAQSKMFWFLLNTITRTTDDLSFFASPSSATDTLSNVIPASKVLVDAIKALDGTKRFLFDDEESRFTDKQALYRWFKIIPGLALIPKIERTASKFK